MDVSIDMGYSSLSKKAAVHSGFRKKKKETFLRTEFKTLLNIGKTILKLEEIMWNSDYAQL